MVLLLDIGNTHTHAGLSDGKRIVRQANFETKTWRSGAMLELILKFTRRTKLDGACFCSVVPKASIYCRKLLQSLKVDALELSSQTIRGVGINYPKPETIGPDRLANALAVKAIFGAPALVVDFGTAVTFDVVDRSGDYIGGIIAPGLSAMTDYLHEKTALLPRIRIREPKAIVGKNTEQAMLIGAVHGYRGLIRELITELMRELGTQKLPVIATGGYADLIAKGMPEITAVRPNLTLDGLRLAWLMAKKQPAALSAR
jgi:type III pantothenate kinase